ncbi:MAG TPA: NfeD family protein [Thermodesulfobacteriaceae bacterium]|nr:NfeD family protein [Thermodesulfobacteriaceae bacterium]
MTVSPVLVWFLIGLAFLGIELALPGFIIFFFGVGALCVALVLIMTDLSLTAQLVIFLVSSLLTLLLLRAWIRSVFLGGSSMQDDSVSVDSDQANGIVTEAIDPPAAGRVKYGGSFWRAVADEPIAEETVVDIVEKNNLTVKVRPLNAEKKKEKRNG